MTTPLDFHEDFPGNHTHNSNGLDALYVFSVIFAVTWKDNIEYINTNYEYKNELRIRVLNTFSENHISVDLGVRI